MHVDEGVIIDVVFGCFLEVVKFFMQELIVLTVLVHDCAEEN
jgi:hypothetical protein